MKRYLPILAAGLMFAAIAASPAKAEVNISIGIGIPPIVVSVPPALVVIPGTYVYIAPDIVDEDVFFYRGWWWRNHDRRWFRSKKLDGPWSYITRERVPSAVVFLPPGYRDHHPGLDRLDNARVRRDWQRWEAERHWDRQAAWREYKHDRKEYREHYKEDRKRDKHGDRDYRKDDHRDDRGGDKGHGHGKGHGRDRD